MIILSHPTGNANVRAIASSFDNNNMLSQFHTSIAAYPGNFWYFLGSLDALKSFKRREFDKELKDKIYTHPYKELGRFTAKSLNINSLIEREVGLFCVDAIYHYLDKKVALALEKSSSVDDIKVVYAYEDGALETFKEAKKKGYVCVYDLPIAYWEKGRTLMLHEAERLPEWADTLGGGILDSVQKLERKVKELELADIVVGPGSFVLDSLPEWASAKNKIMSPFGSPLVPFFQEKKIRKDGDPLRILFVGSMGQRKGLGDLFEAGKLLKNENIEIVVLGSLLQTMEFYKGQFSDFVYEGIRSHKEVLEVMRSCDIFCLPSIVEGRALVMQEAMSQGLPLIITANTGGADLIKHGETGFLVPINSPEKIAEKISWFNENRSLIPEMSRKAYEHSQNYTWEKYGDKIVRNIKEMIL